jgi:hypothetical protein
MSNFISIFTTMTNPAERMDPWKEALNCYKELADEVVIVGEDWPEEFKFEYIGQTFQKGFNKGSGDWAIRMDLDYFFHENDLQKIISVLEKNTQFPAVAFPQYQFFTPERYQIKTKICVALNKKQFPDIRLNGGGDLCLPTINGKRIHPKEVPFFKIPLYQYDSMFRTKEVIAYDRGRFARAWYRQFDDWGVRGGGSSEEAFAAWFDEVKKKYKKHTHRITKDRHPVYIRNKLNNLNNDQFGYSAFGLRDTTKREFKEYLRGYYNKYLY